ncbi:sensor histidine kinase [Hymenobacter pini]|uniref:sensor histidine kinase n=1 Tax=Hymenobacter pini TaxID=2880879 RepID=UPI001CF447F1|nr:sensor histidine kinase [Hymenobacter pini]MCA8832791.1 histidine kinase [Hymenobacter pini]
MKRLIPVCALLLGLVGLLLSRPAASQPALAFRTLTAQDGLAENSVYAVVQDRRGFLWVATQDGLSRYDGVSFRTFRNDARQSASLGSNFVLALCQDSAGYLWAGTGGGLSRYDPATGRFRTFRAAPGDASGLPDNFVLTVLCDRQGRVWAGTESGLHRFQAATQRFTSFRHQAGPGGSVRRNAVRALAQDRAGRLWAGTGEGGVSWLDTVRNCLVPDTRLPAAGPIKALCADHRGGLWVGTETGALHYLPPGGGAARVVTLAAVTRGKSGTISIKTIFEDRAGTLWIGTGAGLARYDAPTGTFRFQQHQPRNPQSLPDNTVQAIFQDQAGMLWVGTEAGLSRADLRPSVFGSVPTAVATGPVWAIASDAAGRVWLGTEQQGVLCYDPATGQQQQFRHNPTDPGSLSQDYVRALCFDRRGRLWVGTQSQGLNCLEPGSKRFVRFRHDPANPYSLADDLIQSVYEDPQGKLWVGHNGGGLSCYNPATGRFTAFRHDPANPGSLPNNYVRATLQDRQGRFWVATGGGGLSRFNPATGRFTTFRVDERTANGLSSNSVRSVLQDRQGTLWVGTEGGGFARLDDPVRGRFTTLREAQGLPNDVVYSMLEDARGNLWLATNQGLARFTPRTRQFLTFDSRDGLLQDEFNAAACHRSAAGSLYFGGVNGVVAFRPEAVRTNPVPPPVVLTALRRFNQPVELADTTITERRKLRLAPEDYVFTLEFAALNYRQPEKNRYAYRLEGFDPAWIEAGNRHEVTYTNLDPGTYTFRVRAANNDGVWSPVGTSLRILVDPPWYGTWWFRIGLSWIVLAGLFLLYRLRVRQLLALERVRHGIARDLHDDMGSTLSSISILSQIARNHQRQHRPEQAAAVLEQIGESSRRMLDAMDDIVWAINPAHDGLDDVTARMRRLASEMLEAAGVELTFRADDAVLPGLRFDMRTRREFFLLFKEALNNLVKYARCQHATITLEYEQGRLLLTVHDDGVGFDPTAPARGSGNGLVNMRARAAAMRGQLTIHSAPGQGTTLQLSVPV